MIAVVQLRFSEALRFLDPTLIILIEPRVSPLRSSRCRPRLLLLPLLEVFHVIIILFSGYSDGIRLLRFAFEELLLPALVVLSRPALRVGVRHDSGRVLSHLSQVLLEYLLEGLRLRGADRDIVDVYRLLTHIIGGTQSLGSPEIH